MAMSGDNSMMSGPENDEEYGDDSRHEKKKKFKPFRKVRNFFRGSSKKRLKPDEGSGTIKSHSTSALNHKIGDTEDEDDEGGFRSGAKRGLAGSRSISEDSIFKTEQKDPAIGVLRGTTVSMEGINTDLQRELFVKLKKRQASSSDLEEEPATRRQTSSYSMYGGGYHKSVPQFSGGKGSAASLTNTEGLHDDNDPFSSNWSSGVAQGGTRMSRSASVDSPTEGQVEVSDFEVVMRKDTSLSNEAAKHRISVKPKSRRSTTKRSMHRKDIKAGEAMLADVKEESPAKEKLQETPVSKPEDSQTGTTTGVLSTTISVGSAAQDPAPASAPVMRSAARDIPAASSRHSREEAKPSSPLSTSPMSQSMLQEVKLRPRPASGKFDGAETIAPATEAEKNELSQAFKKVKRISKRWETEGQTGAAEVVSKEAVGVEVKDKVDTKKTISVKQPSKDSSEVKDTKSPVSSPAVETPTKSPTGVSYVLKKEPLRPGVSKESFDSKKDAAKPTTLDTSGATKQDVKVNVVVKLSPTESQPSTDSKVANAQREKVTSAQTEPSQSKLGSPQKLASPKEDYRLKRQSRSKTLPEHSVPREIIGKDTKDDSASKKPLIVGSPPLSNLSVRAGNYDNVALNAESRGIPSKRASWASETGPSSSVAEAPWVIRARLKKAEQDKIQEKEESKATKEDKPSSTTNVTEETQTPAVSASSVKPLSSSLKPSPYTSKPTVSSVKTGFGSSLSSTAGSVRSPFGGNVISSVKPPSTQSSNTGSVSALGSDKPAQSTVSSNRATRNTSGTSQPTNLRSTGSTSVKPVVTHVGSKSSQDNKTSTETTAPEKTALDKANTQKQTTGKSIFDKQPTFQSVKPFGSANTSVTKSEPKEPITKKISPVAIKKMEDSKVVTTSSVSGSSKSVGGGVSDKKTGSQERFVKPETSGNVPAWKQALNKKKESGSVPTQVKIQIIDKEDKTPKAVEKKVDQAIFIRPFYKKPMVLLRERPIPEKCADAGNRSSKVLDIVKNFQNYQVT